MYSSKTAKLSGKWEPEQVERDAAWEMYVDVVTRISVMPLAPGQGILREALNLELAVPNVRGDQGDHPPAP